MDDDIEFSIDPYDLLQEHDLQIHRLIKAHNQTSKMFEQMAQQHEHMAKALSDQQHRIQRIEHLVETIAKSI